MIIVFYTAFNDKMKKFSSIGIFSSLEILKSKLRTKNFILIYYKIITLPFSLKISKRIKTEEITFLFKDLSIMLKSGLSLSNSLTLIINNLKNPSLKLLLLQLSQDIKSGKSLRSSICYFEKILSPFYINLIVIGEESGTLPQTLELISENIKKNLLMKKKINSLLIYPIFVFSVTIILSIILINFVLPEFIKIFNENSIPLPFITLILLKIYAIFSNFFYYIIITILLIFFSFYLLLQKEIGKNFLYKTLTHFFPLYRVYTSFFLLKNLSILLESGISLFSSLKTLCIVERNPILKFDLNVIVENLKKGATFHSSIKDSYFFPKTVLSMISVGENTGTLPLMISSASELLYYRFNNLLERILLLIEPLTLIVLGGIIGTIILGLYLPMFDAFSIIK